MQPAVRTVFPGLLAMALYGFKTLRNMYETYVFVHPVTPVPRCVSAGYKRRRPGRSVEVLQVFETREKAEYARRAELMASEFSRLDAATRREMLKTDLDRLARFGLSFSSVARICGLSHPTLLAFAQGKRNPNPRKVAKVHILADYCETFEKRFRSVLTDAAGCGNAAMARHRKSGGIR